MPDDVDSVAFSAPPFISQDPSTWFSILECNFKASKITELLSKEELGGEKPTDLLRRMKKLLGDKYTSFDKELFLQLFYQRPAS
ncbi:hypothetical protein O3P69_012171 [Scylla paramamosain]|uniref:Uncharacterized protein n=1 Tax=Scylla paramamosain TaxID=85552 RepID=A0AAW0TCT2_SCYPA